MRTLLFAAAFLASTPVWAIQAQPVPVPEDQSTQPQIDIAGVGIATGAYGKVNGQSKFEPSVNFDDSAIQVGAAQRLYGGGVGSLGVGGVTNDSSSRGTGTTLFLDQAFADFQNEFFEALIGRSDNPVAHPVDFPTLRGDDLITLLSPLNPYSNGQNIEEHRYSNVASLTYNRDLKYFANVHAQHLIDSAGIGTDNGINSYGFSLEYLGPPGMEAFQSLVSGEIGYEHQTLGLNQVYFGEVMNLAQGVTDRWDVRVQDILSWGSELRAFSNETDTFQANSNAAAASLRYLRSPFGKPGSQIALTAAYKTYFKVSEASSWGGALTGVERLGQGFDLVAQYLGQWRGRALASAQAGGLSYEQVIEVGFVFNFDAVFNEHITPRRSLLNQRHQYVPL